MPGSTTGQYRDLSKFALFNVSPDSGRNFYINSVYDTTKLGTWHILPNEADLCRLALTEGEFLSRLGEGNDVFLYLHGNAYNRALPNRVRVYKLLSRMGFHVVTFDYRGYGDSSGTPDREEGLVSDTLTALQYIQKHAPTSRIFIWGHSLGTGIVSALYKHLQMHELPNQVRGILLDAPFDDLSNVVWFYNMPFWGVPYLHRIIRKALESIGVEYNTGKNLKFATVPISIVHSMDDFIIPYPMARHLYKVLTDAGRDVRFFGLGWSGYGHKKNYSSPQMPEIIRDLVKRASPK